MHKGLGDSSMRVREFIGFFPGAAPGGHVVTGEGGKREAGGPALRLLIFQAPYQLTRLNVSVFMTAHRVIQTPLGL